ncbi:hypothetical protein BGX38DRAFT_1267940 [Terfezia claveryi]|nr:hypothetical protein BGX38DRAFT_1267940 [Terfezia claveryi]
MRPETSAVRLEVGVLWGCRAAVAGVAGYQGTLIVDVDDDFEAMNAYKAMNTLECSGVFNVPQEPLPNILKPGYATSGFVPCISKDNITTAEMNPGTKVSFFSTRPVQGLADPADLTIACSSNLMP